jgi:V8-like Glu-specific endopeptidase
LPRIAEHNETILLYYLQTVKPMLKNQKKLALTLLAGTSYLVSLTGMMQVLPQAQAQTPAPQVPTAPLSPNDPAAKLDPALVNVPAIQAPKSDSSQNRTNSSAPVRTISFDLKTGQTQESANLPATTSTTSSSVSAPSMGLSPNVVAEPRAGVPLPTSGVQPNSIIGADNRIKITDTTSYPWRTATKLIVTFPKGKGGCTGTIIAAKYVLTAGHCVHNKDYGGWAKKIEVIPGLNGTYKPFGSALATKYRTYTGWTSSADRNHDFALLTLDKSIGNSTGTLGYASYSSVNGLTGHIAGYPCDKGGLHLYYHYGLISSSTSKRLSYQIDTYGCQSGSGIYRIVDGKRYVFGVHAYGVGSSSPNHNSGTRIDSTKFNSIKSWIASGT